QLGRTSPSALPNGITRVEKIGTASKPCQWAVEVFLAGLQPLPDGCVDALIKNPPYSSGGMYRSDRRKEPSEKYVKNGTQVVRPEFAGDNRDQRSFGYWCSLWLGECQRIAKPGAPICVFADWRQLSVVTDVIQAGGWVLRGVA